MLNEYYNKPKAKEKRKSEDYATMFDYIEKMDLEIDISEAQI